VYTEDMKSDCSILTLQVAQGGDWRDVGACLAERAPRTVRIDPGQQLAVSLDLSSSHFAAGAPGPGSVPAGTYRLRLVYRFSSEPQGQTETAYSPPFNIVP
jgi:hypothetical protein